MPKRAVTGAVLLLSGLALGYLVGAWSIERRMLPPLSRVTVAEAGLDFEARLEPLPEAAADALGAGRWDGLDPNSFSGRYGDYLLQKVGKVFPDLGSRYLGDGPADD